MPLLLPDEVAVNLWLTANAAFWTASLACLGLDSVPRSTRLGRWLFSCKAQGEKSYISREDYNDALALAFVNMTFVALLATPMILYWRHGCGGRCEPLATESAIAPRREAFNLLVCVLTVDVWFYWTHRALHWPALYRRIHKIHHRYKAPVAAVAVYAHPLEFLVGNIAGVLIGPVLSNCHPYTAYLWVATSLVSTCGAHSGYTFFSAQKHDDHHQFFNWNFGVGPMCDVLFGSQMDTPGVRPKTAPVVNSFGGTQEKRA